MYKKTALLSTKNKIMVDNNAVKAEVRKKWGTAAKFPPEKISRSDAESQGERSEGKKR